MRKYKILESDIDIYTKKHEEEKERRDNEDYDDIEGYIILCVDVCLEHLYVVQQ
jgi:hypothetical protein